MAISIREAGVVSAEIFEVRCNVPRTQDLRLVEFSKGCIRMEMEIDVIVKGKRKDDSYTTCFFLDAKLVVMETKGRGVYDTHPFCNISFQETWEMSCLDKGLKVIVEHAEFGSELRRVINRRTSETPFEDKDVGQEVLSFLRQLPTCE